MNLVTALQGSKTHLLVGLAVLINAYMDMESGTGMDMGTAISTIQLALVSTFKAGVDRLAAKLST
jgi:hypothetical protein